MQVYEKVRKYITDHGLCKCLIAQKCNISVSSFNDMLNGNRKMYAEDLRAICYALEVSPEEFIDCRKNRI